MEIARYQQDGTKSGAVTLPEGTFALPKNTDLLHQAVKTLADRERRVLAHTKTRGEVRGGGKKPWRQKGTGRARHGSTRSPIWRSGGVTFGPRRDRNFSSVLPKQMRQRALGLALSEKTRAGQVAIIAVLNLEEVKTKHFAAAVTAVAKSAFGEGAEKKSILLVTSEYNPALARASRNLRNISLVSAAAVNALDILSAQYLLVTEEAIAILEGRMSKSTNNSPSPKAPSFAKAAAGRSAEQGKQPMTNEKPEAEKKVSAAQQGTGRYSAQPRRASQSGSRTAKASGKAPMEKAAVKKLAKAVPANPVRGREGSQRASAANGANDAGQAGLTS